MTISWDLFVLLFALVAVLYSVLLGRNRIVGILVNLYVSLSVVLVSGGWAYDFFSNFEIISNQITVTEFAVKTIFLVFIIALLSIKSEIAGLDSGGSVSKLQAGIYGFFTSGLLLSIIFSFMSESQIVELDSNFVNILANNYQILIILPVLFMIGTAFIKKS